MQMGMMQQVLSPGVKDGEEADCCAQMPRIGGNDLERFSRGPEENPVDGPLVVQADIRDLFGHRKDDMEILAVENLGLPVLYPLGASQRLALGAMTVRTRVVPDALMPAPVADLHVTAKNSGAAALDGGHDTPLRPR